MYPKKIVHDTGNDFVTQIMFLSFFIYFLVWSLSTYSL
jgi:hypothetical protein